MLNRKLLNPENSRRCKFQSRKLDFPDYPQLPDARHKEVESEFQYQHLCTDMLKPNRLYK